MIDSKKIVRNDGRTPDQIRPVSFSRNIYEYAAGSVLFEMGKTKVTPLTTPLMIKPAAMAGLIVY